MWSKQIVYNACCFQKVIQFVIDVLFHKISISQVVNRNFTCAVQLLSITILLLTGSRPLYATSFVFCADIIKPCALII